MEIMNNEEEIRSKAKWEYGKQREREREVLFIGYNRSFTSFLENTTHTRAKGDNPGICGLVLYVHIKR